MRNNILTGFLILAVVAALGSIAFAGGPLIVDAKTRRAYHYDVSEAVPIYYDRGNFGLAWDYSVDPPRQVPLSNWYGKRMVEKGFGDWGNVATSSLRTTVRGNFSQLGLPDITASNITQIIGKSNGRGIYIVFDEDGSIMSDFFGVGPRHIDPAIRNRGNDDHHRKLGRPEWFRNRPRRLKSGAVSGRSNPRIRTCSRSGSHPNERVRVFLWRFCRPSQLFRSSLPKRSDQRRC